MSEQVIIPRRKPRTGKIGIMAVGHDTYWEQFDGLLDELMGYHKTFVDRVESYEIEVSDFGMVDDPKSAYAALPKIKAADVDVLFVNMVTYATSSTFGSICRALEIPVVLVALQPLSGLDYDKASTYMQLCNDNICSMPEFAGVARRMGKPVPYMIIGMLHDDPESDKEVRMWCDIAKVLHDVKRARIGHIGHVLEAMYDMHSDPTAFTAQFGCHIVQAEIDDIVLCHREVTDEEVAAKIKEIEGMFDFPTPKSDPITTKVTEKDLTVAAKVAVALDKFVEKFDLDGLAYYYEGEPGSEQAQVAHSLIVGNSLLTAAGFPMCGESDLKTCLGMMIMDRLNIGGSFAEFHPIDFEEGFVLVGHDGPHHINIAEGRPVLRSLLKYHGKPGAGASVEFKIKEGPMTMLSVSSTDEGKFKFVITEGESVAGPIPPTGNTNTRGFFKPDVRTFLKRWLAEGPTHHFALGIGNHAKEIKLIADALGIEAVIIDND